MSLEQIGPLLTRLIAGYGTPKRGLGAIQVKPLIRIPEAPRGYQELKCALYGIYDDGERELAVKKFHARFPDFVPEIKDYVDRLYEIRKHNYFEAEWSLAKNHVTYVQEGFDPIERIELKEMDGKSSGKFQWMLLINFDFKRQDGRLKRQKIYIPLNPERYFERNIQTTGLDRSP